MYELLNGFFRIDSGSLASYSTHHKKKVMCAEKVLCMQSFLELLQFELPETCTCIKSIEMHKPHAMVTRTHSKPHTTQLMQHANHTGSHKYANYAM